MEVLGLGMVVDVVDTMGGVVVEVIMRDKEALMEVFRGQAKGNIKCEHKWKWRINYDNNQSGQ